MCAQLAANGCATLAELEPSLRPNGNSGRKYSGTARQKGTPMSPERLVLEHLCQDRRVTDLTKCPGLESYSQRGIDFIIKRIKRAYGVNTLTGAVAKYLTSPKQPDFVGKWR